MDERAFESVRPTKAQAMDRSFERDVLPLAHHLYIVALHYTKNGADAEDLVQDTLLKAFRAFDKTRADTYYKAWLTTIMRNTWISKYRAAACRPAESLVADVLDYEPSTVTRIASIEHDSPEQQLLRRSLDTDVLQLVRGLSAEMRETLYLVAIEGMNCHEAAQVLGVSSSTVSSRMQRIRHRLRKPPVANNCRHQPPEQPGTDVA